MFKTLFITILIASQLVFTSEVGATELAPISLSDQFDKPQVIDTSTEILIFAHDMSGNDIVEEAFKDLDGDKLSAANTVFLADVSGMPSLIAKLFALPAMRDRAYPIVLDKEGDISAQFANKEDQVTVFFLDGLQIKDTKYAATASELNELLIK